ncbi:unnamed protein product [Spirodela intermedia]|uniref:non-specific serine/threonine protein kinase n=1 Tax=Spirodela intermedia TaxID=51605 RepID=A0A7I8KCM4_SPIIN|nr:unnamed protein product [Spirodela intermedia]
MKHILKKLHRGGSHDPGRSSHEVSASTVASPSSSSPSAASPQVSFGSDHRRQGDGVVAGQAIAEPPQSPGDGSVGGTGAAADRADYFSSEEEFQVQLALAISASNSEHREDPDGDQIRAATLLSLGKDKNGAAGEEQGTAEALSRQYWDYNVLDYNVKVTDGFYDIFSLSLDRAGQNMPPLADFQTNIGDLGFEVIIVNRAIDPALVELEQVAQCIALGYHLADVEHLVQRISDLVMEHMGGPVRDANYMLARWMEQSSALRASLHTSLLPIGEIRVGLSRHRALLFKVLADHVGIPCKLVRGNHYTGVDDDAVDLIKLGGREYLVDLMAAPGTLIPADALNGKDPSLNLSNSRKSRSLTDGANDSVPTSSSAEAYNGNDTVNKPVPEDSGFVGRSSGSEKAVALPSFPSPSREESSSTSGSSLHEEISTPAEVERPHKLLPATRTGSQKQHSDVSFPQDGVKEKVTGPSQSQDHLDSRNLFAELNPFLTTGLGKTSSLMSKSTEIKNNEPQRRRENIASGPGRPPLPLVWKNRFTCNEFSNKRQHDFVEGNFPRKNLEVKDLNASTSSSHSSVSPESINSEIPKHNVAGISGVPYPAEKCGSGDEHYGFFENEKDIGANYSHMLQSNDGYGANNDQKKNPYSEKPQQLKENSLQNSLPNGPNIGKNRSDQHAWRKVTSTNLKDAGSSSILDHSGTQQLDPMLDDVAECEILWEDLVIGERIGLGSYGEVYRAEWNSKEVAVKKFLDQDFYGDALDEFRREVRIMRRLRHPNVVLFMGAVTRPPNLSIVTEFLPRGSLYRILHRSNSHIDEKRRIKMALDVAMGMNCLHASAPTIVHRDLKSPNLLVDMDWNVKVGDFGLSRLKHNTFLSSKSTGGTPEWMAPEVLRNEPSNEKCDVYSFGVILWELATMRMPWSGMNPMQVVGAVGFQNRRLDIPKEVDSLVERIIWQCWQTDPSLRPSFAQLTSSLKPLKRLVVPPDQGPQGPPYPLQVSVNSTNSTP